MSARVMQWIQDERIKEVARIIVASSNERCVTVNAALAAISDVRRQRRHLHFSDPLVAFVDSGIKYVTIVDYDTDQTVAIVNITELMIHADSKEARSSET